MQMWVRTGSADEKKGALQRSATRSEAVGEVPGIVYDVLREPGQPLDAATRSYFEPRFGARVIAGRDRGRPCPSSRYGGV